MGPTFSIGETLYLFSGADRAKVFCSSDGLGKIQFSAASKAAVFARNGAYVRVLKANVTLPGGYSFADSLKAPSNTVNKYFAVRFNSGGNKYGWVHVQSPSSDGSWLKVTRWGYNDQVGGTITTLADSISARQLSLSDGRVKLYWANANEDGIARYEVQTKDAVAGAWKAVRSDAVGAGAYSATVPSNAEYRVVVEKVDGTTEEVAF